MVDHASSLACRRIQIVTRVCLEREQHREQNKNRAKQKQNKQQEQQER